MTAGISGYSIKNIFRSRFCMSKGCVLSPNFEMNRAQKNSCGKCGVIALVTSMKSFL